MMHKKQYAIFISYFCTAENEDCNDKREKCMTFFRNVFWIKLQQWLLQKGGDEGPLFEVG